MQRTLRAESAIGVVFDQHHMIVRIAVLLDEARPDRETSGIAYGRRRDGNRHRPDNR